MDAKTEERLAVSVVLDLVGVYLRAQKKGGHAMRSKAKELKEKMKQRRNTKATLKDITLLLRCREKDNFDPMQQTKLYQNHGGEYCEYLEMI